MKLLEWVEFKKKCGLRIIEKTTNRNLCSKKIGCTKDYCCVLECPLLK